MSILGNSLQLLTRGGDRVIGVCEDGEICLTSFMSSDNFLNLSTISSDDTHGNKVLLSTDNGKNCLSFFHNGFDILPCDKLFFTVHVKDVHDSSTNASKSTLSGRRRRFLKSTSKSKSASTSKSKSKSKKKSKKKKTKKKKKQKKKITYV